MKENCRFRWYLKSTVFPNEASMQECIRLKGHSGNHVSYPSGEEHYNDPDDDVHAGKPASEHVERNRTSSND